MRDGSNRTPDEPGQQPPAGLSDGEPGAVHVIVGTESTRIVLSGEVDADLGPELQEATAEAEQVGLPIEVDAHHVTFMDSSGVAFLARLSIRSQHRVKLLRVPPTVRFLLEVTRIGELLDVVEGDDDRSFQPVGETDTTS
ncbi:STAS domain-containing protein [Cellulomonas massiliensis]|uniref:STAS domain-containing protein n=1 Tax=Cellulomonas massiliensis TaxID=1465811 RepID=UPI0004749734|nr:STAS domain-containing protein [Cellulomonas massiliensis]